MDKIEALHCQRRMFCITSDHIIHLARSDDSRSHLQWFVEEGWLNETDPITFLFTTVRGFFYPDTNSLYSYIGTDFSFDLETVQTVRTHIQSLRKLLDLNDETLIYFGPKDISFGGRSYQQICCGHIKNFVDCASS